MNYLITGASNGLGKAIADVLGGYRFTRQTDLLSLNDENFDAIVHCAFNSTKDVTTANATTYIADNLFLTQRLLELRCDKFIYVSSVDVYPPSQQRRVEDVDYRCDELRGLYPFTKLASEIAVRQRARDYLILRPVTMLGSCMRPNTTSRLLTERAPRLFLHRDSRFNYVLYRDIIEFLRLAIADNVSGTFNIASSTAIRLGDWCDALGLAPIFGSHVYDVGDVANERACAHYPAFGRSSAETLNLFIGALGSSFVGEGRLP